MADRVEDELAERFRAPRAGLRAALIGPEALGPVERIRNRGSRVRVRRATVEEAVARAPCRTVLAGLRAARTAATAHGRRRATGPAHRTGRGDGRGRGRR
ncbi:hypothetical protein [Streptomyces sp. NPDC007000]|uniref:hypothetical protein n=1 Tax=Streptomyces sp. NPDC007000 TaxID=3155357 RepID=UPI0033FAD569